MKESREKISVGQFANIRLQLVACAIRRAPRAYNCSSHLKRTARGEHFSERWRIFCYLRGETSIPRQPAAYLVECLRDSHYSCSTANLALVTESARCKLTGRNFATETCSQANLVQHCLSWLKWQTLFSLSYFLRAFSQHFFPLIGHLDAAGDNGTTRKKPRCFNCYQCWVSMETEMPCACAILSKI